MDAPEVAVLLIMLTSRVPRKRRTCSCPRAMMSTAAAKLRSAAWEIVSVERKAHSENWCGKSLVRRWETLQAQGSESTWSPQHCLRDRGAAKRLPKGLLRKGVRVE